MKISELINKLQEIQEQYGDLRCVTPGFDEAGVEDLNQVEVCLVSWNTSNPNHHGGQHSYADNEGDFAVSLNWCKDHMYVGNGKLPPPMITDGRDRD